MIEGRSDMARGSFHLDLVGCLAFASQGRHPEQPHVVDPQKLHRRLRGKLRSGHPPVVAFRTYVALWEGHEVLRLVGRHHSVARTLDEARCWKAYGGAVGAHAREEVDLLVLAHRNPSALVGDLRGGSRCEKKAGRLSTPLFAGARFHGYLTDHRGDGSKYRVEIDCRPTCGRDGRVEYFMSFERDVVRRVGRPAPGFAGRYEPLTVSNDLLTGPTRALGAFPSGEIRHEHPL